MGIIVLWLLGLLGSVAAVVGIAFVLIMSVSMVIGIVGLEVVMLLPFCPPLARWLKSHPRYFSWALRRLPTRREAALVLAGTILLAGGIWWASDRAASEQQELAALTGDQELTMSQCIKMLGQKRGPVRLASSVADLDSSVAMVLTPVWLAAATTACRENGQAMRLNDNSVPNTKDAK